jgi:1-deoxy-D-xylulose-5-phosphate reductoisomerase
VIGIALLGATGSIGASTLRVVAAHPDRLRVVSLASAGRDLDAVAAAARATRAEVVAIADPDGARKLASQLPGVEVLAGAEGVAAAAVAPGVDRVVAAIVGAAGLPPVWAALDQGRDVALANKEALVVAGPLLTALARARGAALLPVDSEHAALHQALRCGEGREVARLVLTASGGPFRTRPHESWNTITVAEALRHPTWSMGAKISVDSATLVNKALELIEAHYLFDVAPDRLDAVVHPQSIVHSFVEFVDGSVLAQLSPNDMAFPVQYALSYPERWQAPAPRLALEQLGRLDFEPVDRARFPALDLARAALLAGPSAPAVFNGANEVAVAAFLAGALPFVAIPAVLEHALAEHTPTTLGNLDDALGWDRWGRQAAEAWIKFHRAHV